MKLNFCTLFDSNYLTRGIALHQSLLETCPNFHMYIYAFDQKAYSVLNELKLSCVTVISLDEFENDELLAVKPTRTAAEYCWTCTPSIIYHSLLTFSLTNCTYIDADLFFYSDPKVLIDEMGDNSVMITEHRYTPEYDQSFASGKYCVQFMTFKNDDRGIEILNWWKMACLKWCYARTEDGKFGDQKYLDDWTVRFKGVHELKHIGGGVAPWNFQQYTFDKVEGKLFVIEKVSGKSFPLIFFHFHSLKFYLNGIIQLSAGYAMIPKVIKCLYSPYVNRLLDIKMKVEEIDADFDPNGAKSVSPSQPYTINDKIHLYKKVLLKFSYNEYLYARKIIADHNYHYLINVLKHGSSI